MTFTVDDAAALPGPDWLRRQRVSAMERFLAGPLPTSADEIWRYSRIDELDLDPYRPAVDRQAASLPPAPASSAPGIEPAAVVRTVDGFLAGVELQAEAARLGVTIASAATFADAGPTGRVSDEAQPWDAFRTLNRALCPDPIVIHVPPGVVLSGPIAVTHRIEQDGAVFPRTFVDAGETSEATVMESLVSAPGCRALICPVIELDVGDGAHLDHLVVQELGRQAWEIAYHGSRVGRDATFRSFTIALGGDYARVRTDSRLVGSGGSTDLLALYFGDGSQMHDFRTLQDHEGPKSTSELIFKGAVSGEARAAYSGLIRVRPGAAGTKAFQTNRNLVLSDSGLASYSVPNLEIEENDVMCSHASATGPIDEDQRFYLESRGVPTDVAERLIVMGFFDELLERVPVAGLRVHVLAAVVEKLRNEAVA